MMMACETGHNMGPQTNRRAAANGKIIRVVVTGPVDEPISDIFELAINYGNRDS